MTITSTFSNVNVGTVPNDGTGDPLRTSFIKINENFQYINQKIWPNLEIDPPSLSADIVSSFISDFNLITAADIVVVKDPGGIIANTVSANSVTANSLIGSVTGSLNNLQVGNLIIPIAPGFGNTLFTVSNVGNSTVFVTNININVAVAGTTRTFIFQNNNAAAAERYLVLPSAFNNRGVSNITMASQANVMIQFTALDNTTANVYAFVAN